MPGRLCLKAEDLRQRRGQQGTVRSTWVWIRDTSTDLPAHLVVLTPVLDIHTIRVKEASCARGEGTGQGSGPTLIVEPPRENCKASQKTVAGCLAPHRVVPLLEQEPGDGCHVEIIQTITIINHELLITVARCLEDLFEGRTFFEAPCGGASAPPSRIHNQELSRLSPYIAPPSPSSPPGGRRRPWQEE